MVCYAWIAFTHVVFNGVLYFLQEYSDGFSFLGSALYAYSCSLLDCIVKMYQDDIVKASL